METNENEVKYSFNAKKSNPILAEFKKKNNKKLGICCLLAGVVFGLFTIMCAMSNNPSVWVCVLFGGFVAVSVICAIYFFINTKPTEKDENIVMEYIFAEYGINIAQQNLEKNTKKYLIKCLYTKYGNKQFIAKLIEYNDRFEFKIYTGTLNGVPQFKSYILPIDVIANDKQAEFKAFLQQKMGSDYITK